MPYSFSRSAGAFGVVRGSPVSRRRASCSSGARPVLIAQMPPLMLRRHAPVNCQRPRSESPGWSEGRGPERSQWYLRSDSLIGKSLIEARRLCISPSQNPKSVGYLSTMPTIEPHWSRDGKQLYFLDEGGWLRSVHLKFSSGLPVAETTDRLFRLNGTTRSGASYAVTPDPGKFLIREPYQAPADPVLVWNSALAAATTPSLATR